MRDMLQFYIDGKWVDPIEPKTLDVINPANEEVCGRISLGSAADVDVARELNRSFDLKYINHPFFLELTAPM